MKNIKFIILTLIIVFLNSCASDSSKKIDINPPEIDKNLNNNIDNNTTIDNEFEMGTTLFGAILDTTYAPIEDARVFTSPITIEVKSDENGDFKLSSDEFVDDIEYIIYFQHADYINDEQTGYYPEIDSENDLGIILLIPKELLDLKTDEITPQLEDSGIPIKDE